MPKVPPSLVVVASSAMLCLLAAGCAGTSATGAPSGPRQDDRVQEPPAADPGRSPACEALPQTASDAERRKYADDVVTRLTRISNAIRGKLSRARGRGDAAEASCQNDKLTRADVTLRATEGHRRELGEAITAADKDAIAQKSALIFHMCTRALRLDQESDGCGAR